MVKNHNKHIGYSLCQQLIDQAFLNDDSILMREERYSGLGYFREFMNTVFGEWDFLASDYRPLQAWSYFNQEVEVWQAEKYCECVYIAFGSYFNSSTIGLYPASLHVALDHLANIASYQISAIEQMEKHEIYSSKQYDIINVVQKGIGKLIDLICKQDNIPEYKLNEHNYDVYEDHSVYGVLAEGVYKYYESLSRGSKNDFSLRMCLIDIWHKIFGVTSSSLSKQQNEIARRLVIHFNKAIEENFDINKRYYPAITRLLISLNGIYDRDPINGDNIGTLFHLNFLKNLKASFASYGKIKLSHVSM